MGDPKQFLQYFELTELGKMDEFPPSNNTASQYFMTWCHLCEKKFCISRNCLGIYQTSERKVGAQQKGLHTCGSKIFAIRLEELKEEHPYGSGVIEFYWIIHTLKIGDIVDEEAKRILKEAGIAFEKYKQENSNSSTIDLLKAERKIMSKVRPERSEHIRGLWLVPTRTSVGISKASASKDGKLRKVKKELKDLKRQMSAVLGILKDSGLDLYSITARVNANQPSSLSQPSSSQQSYSSNPSSSSQMQ